MLGSFDPEAWAALFEVVAFDRADADDEDDVPLRASAKRKDQRECADYEGA